VDHMVNAIIALMGINAAAKTRLMTIPPFWQA
jgi:hypothetical protein